MHAPNTIQLWDRTPHALVQTVQAVQALRIPCALVLSSRMVHVEPRRGAAAGAAEVLLRQAREAQKLQRCAFEVWFFYVFLC